MHKITGGQSSLGISNAANDEKWRVNQVGDLAADIALAAGNVSDQLRQAADYYLQIKALNPAASITFTGHSLGVSVLSPALFQPPLECLEIQYIRPFQPHLNHFQALQ